MRRGYTNLWKYDGFPRNADIVTISENGVNESIPLEELPGTFIEREYERKFPSYETPAHDNDSAVARFNALRGKGTKVTKEVTEVSQTTRREETYARLADKMRGNKWFDENA